MCLGPSGAVWPSPHGIAQVGRHVLLSAVSPRDTPPDESSSYSSCCSVTISYGRSSIMYSLSLSVSSHPTVSFRTYTEEVMYVCPSLWSYFSNREPLGVLLLNFVWRYVNEVRPDVVFLPFYSQDSRTCEVGTTVVPLPKFSNHSNQYSQNHRKYANNCKDHSQRNYVWYGL